MVEVLAPDGRRYNNLEDGQIWVNGVAGSMQYLRWDRPGVKPVFVLADWDDEPPERVVQEIVVQPAESDTVQPRLIVKRRLEAPTSLEFRVVFHDVLKPALIRDTLHRATTPDSTARMPDSRVRVAGQGRAKSVAGSGRTLAEFVWDFGDGVRPSTRVGRVVHDFGPHLLPGRDWSVFNVSVRIRKGQDEPVELKCTVSVLNDYEVSKGRGLIQPPVDYNLNARFVKGTGFVTGFTVRNVERYPLELTSRQIELFFRDRRQPSQLLSRTPVRLRVRSARSTSFRIVVPHVSIPADAIGFAVHYTGKTMPRVGQVVPELGMQHTQPSTGSRFSRAMEVRPETTRPQALRPVAETGPVRVSTYHDIPSRWVQHGPRLEQSVAAVLDSLVDDQKVSSATVIPVAELEDLVLETEARQTLHAGPYTSNLKVSLNKLKSSLKPNLRQTARSGHTAPQMPAEGQECDPTNLPSSIPDNLACQATDERDWVLMPARFMNAKKGDVVLSSSEGLIGGLLRQTNPPQYYSHSGIMTRNHDEITHSTASDSRIEGYPVGSLFGEPAPSQGFRPDVLKYAWPGVITQQVKHAVEGELFHDPACHPATNSECDEEYTVSGFNPNDSVNLGRAEVVHPRVVKPEPIVETPALRTELYEAADIATGEEGESHYRFFAFTDPTVGLDGQAPSSAGWASGTYGSVCSSFVWMCLRQIGAKLEGGIEAVDAGHGAELGPDSEDGLYLYRAEERLAAGEWLFHQMRMKVEEILENQINSDFLEFWAEAGSDIADDAANQFVNTFASDWSDLDAADSDDWRNTTDARAVSPDNILFWDSPAQGGLYGYSEPLIFRPDRYERITIHRWRIVQGKGNVRGTVWIGGQPLDGARVELYDGMFAPTANQGRFLLTDVPEGNYIAKAYKIVDEVYHSAETPVTVMRDQDTDVDIDLEPPSDVFRAVVLEASTLLIDDEWGAAANPVSYAYGDAVLRVGPYDTHDETLLIDDVCDGDVRARLYVEADLMIEDRSVTITFTLRIFENADTADGIDSEMTRTFNVSAGGTGTWKGMKLYNDDDDNVKLRYLYATNNVQNN